MVGEKKQEGKVELKPKLGGKGSKGGSGFSSSSSEKKGEPLAILEIDRR